MVNLKMSVIAAQPPLGYGRRPCWGSTSLPAITGEIITGGNSCFLCRGSLGAKIVVTGGIFLGLVLSVHWAWMSKEKKWMFGFFLERSTL